MFTLIEAQCMSTRFGCASKYFNNKACRPAPTAQWYICVQVYLCTGIYGNRNLMDLCSCCLYKEVLICECVAAKWRLEYHSCFTVF